MEPYYVYVLSSLLDESWYIGYSQNLDKRLTEHNSGKTVTTNRKKTWRIIYYEVSYNKEDAISREKYLKSGMGRRYLKNRLKNQLDF